MHYHILTFLLVIILIVSGQLNFDKELDDLRVKVDNDVMPLFEFQDSLNKIIELHYSSSSSSSNSVMDASLLECEILFNNYMDRLRDHYYRSFSLDTNKVDIRDTSALQELMDHYKSECKTAMAASIPKHATCVKWNYEGPLNEFMVDVETLVTELKETHEIQDDITVFDIDSDADEEEKIEQDKKYNNFGRVLFAFDRFRNGLKRLISIKMKPNSKASIWTKWIISQSVVLFANYVQFEWQRKSAKHTADKRSADVPGFPLL
jgi:hypothetical protein